jgi:hypothetical protein
VAQAPSLAELEGHNVEFDCVDRNCDVLHIDDLSMAAGLGILDYMRIALCRELAGHESATFVSSWISRRFP